MRLSAILKLMYLLIISLPVVAQQQNSFEGTFANSELTVTFSASSQGFTGQALYLGQTLPMTAKITSASTIQGNYTLNAVQLPFQAQLQGDTMYLLAGGETYVLQRQKHQSQNSLTNTATAGTASKAKMQLAVGEVGDPYLGFKFRQPEGWQAQKNAQGYLLGSQTKKGFALIMPHQYKSVAELKAAAGEGISDENGTMLNLNGDPKPFDKNGLAVDYEGLVEWQQARVKAIGLLSPFGGGITVLVGVEKASYSEEYSQLAKQLARSTIFFKPEKPPVDQEWLEWLRGARLTYLWSYYSGGSVDGSYAGGSQKTIIDLCPQGYFTYSDNNQMAVDGGYGTGYNASGYGSGSGQGNGKWQVLSRGEQPVLQLTFHDGRVQEHALSYQDGKTYLDNKRYFRTFADDPIAEHRPECY